MIITEYLNGRVIEDIRRNEGGSVSLFSDSGRVLTLHVLDGQIVPLIQKYLVATGEVLPKDSSRLRLRESFQGYEVERVLRDEGDGSLIFEMVSLKHNRLPYVRAAGFRKIKMTHSAGRIDDLPEVSAVISLQALTLTGEMHTPD